MMIDCLNRCIFYLWMSTEDYSSWETRYFLMAMPAAAAYYSYLGCAVTSDHMDADDIMLDNLDVSTTPIGSP
ncbi:hypothetical protein FRB94_003156 [Tulasnella sp. JGI-2019a]|nr:hypothetical protein FRB94_003156 [Tulasnella sp. JGI-2019a]